MKKSGLADSPFFTASKPEVVIPTPTQVEKPVYERSSVQMNERTNERANVPTNARPDEQTSEPTQKPVDREYHRYTYDLFDDQAEAIDELTFRWRKEKGKHVTKGFVIRTLLDEALKLQR